MRRFTKAWPAAFAIVPLIVWLGCTGDDPNLSTPEDDAGQESGTSDAANDSGGDGGSDGASDGGRCDPTKPFEGTGTRFGATINRGSTTYGARLSPEMTTIYFTSLGPGANNAL